MIMTLKSTLLAVAGLTSLLSGLAQAADLPLRVPPPPLPAVPIFTWTGAYAGANIGAAFLNGTADPACLNPSGVSLGTGCATAPTLKLRSAGIEGGAQAGYNYHYDILVMGIEADFQGAGIDKTSIATGTFPQTGGTFTAPGTISAKERLNDFGTLRARLGLAYGQALFYATAGLIYGDVNTSYQRLFPAVAFVGSDDALRYGFVVGGGLEYAFTNHWSAKLEGLYYDLGSKRLLSSALPVANGFQTGFRFREDGEIARVGLNYKFW